MTQPQARSVTHARTRRGPATLDQGRRRRAATLRSTSPAHRRPPHSIGPRLGGQLVDRTPVKPGEIWDGTPACRRLRVRVPSAALPRGPCVSAPFEPCAESKVHLVPGLRYGDQQRRTPERAWRPASHPPSLERTAWIRTAAKARGARRWHPSGHRAGSVVGPDGSSRGAFEGPGLALFFTESLCRGAGSVRRLDAWR